MKVLFIGGTGTISTACTRHAVDAGVELTLLNRGQRQADLPDGVETIQADITDVEGTRRALGDRTWDAVVDWIVFDTDQVERDIGLFAGRTGQYVFISSASAYQKPPTDFVITESTPLVNPFWEYSRKKIACEERLLAQHRADGFPVTIVRPSHTYGPTMLPTAVGRGPVVVSRIRAGKPVIVHGDGESLWTLTHNSDFAGAFTGILGNPRTVGHAVHITSDEALTWNQIYQRLGTALGVEPQVVHVPSDVIARYDEPTGAGLLGDKAISVVFDNSKIKRWVPGWRAVVPFSEGVKGCVAWLDEDPARVQGDPAAEGWMDRLLADVGG